MILLLCIPLIILHSVEIRASDLGLRIVGGQPVAISERPFQIVIYREITIGFVPDCGGAIIHRRWILTAAHCVNNMSPEGLVIRAGIDDLEDQSGAPVFDIARVIVHEDFSDASSVTVNDIALLMTKEEIEFTPNIKSIKVRTKSPSPSMEAVVSGFGVTKEGDVLMSNILREVAVEVVNRTICVELLAKITTEIKLSDTHFCAAYLEGGRDACQGDSGGPITIDGNLAGIVSWGIGCAEEMVPAFYTDVSQYVPWIQKNMIKYSKRYTRRYKSQE